MQRRRRSKAVPKDIFGNAPKPAPDKKKAPSTAAPTKPTAPPIPEPPSTADITESMHDESVTESDTNDESSQTVEDEVIESQILGVTRRKSIGLRPREEVVINDTTDDGPSNKAQELIDESRVRAEVEDKKREKPKTVAAKVTIEAP